MSQILPPFPSFTKTWHSTSYPSIDPKNPNLSTKGKTAVITGGGAGIGKAITRAFAAAGSTKIAILGRRENVLKDTAKEIEDEFRGVKILTHSADVKDAKSVDKAFDDIAKAFGGKIDITISNAGYLAATEPIADVDGDDWWSAFETNIQGSFNIARAFLKHAKPDAGAALVDINTGIVHMPTVPGHSAYAASKAGSLKMYEYLAAENPGVQIVSLQPGVVSTNMSQKSGFPGLDDVSLPAHMAVWLVSEQAHFLRGKLVWSNWDVEELLARKAEIEKDDKLFSMQLEGVSFRDWTMQRVQDWAAANA